MVALAAVMSSMWIVFALVYKLVTWIRTGRFYWLGAPTPIGYFNKAVLALLVFLTTVGLVLAVAGEIFRLRMGLRSARTGREPQPSDPSFPHAESLSMSSTSRLRPPST